MGKSLCSILWQILLLNLNYLGIMCQLKAAKIYRYYIPKLSSLGILNTDFSVLKSVFSALKRIF